MYQRRLIRNKVYLNNNRGQFYHCRRPYLRPLFLPRLAPKTPTREEIWPATLVYIYPLIAVCVIVTGRSWSVHRLVARIIPVLCVCVHTFGHASMIRVPFAVQTHRATVSLTVN